MSLEKIFDRLRTQRLYANRPLVLPSLSDLLWAAAGKRYGPDAVGGASRSYPAAAGVYPLQPYVVARAPATVVLAADYDRISGIFRERGRNLYAPFDAGCVAQNLRLTAAVLDLAVGIAGEFDHAQVQKLLGTEAEPILLLAFGHRY